MLTKGNVEIGIETRFGSNWPGIRCGARTKAGGECQRPAVKRTGRCTRHGGKSTGPRTQAGRDKITASQTVHGRLTKEKRTATQKRVEVGRKVLTEIKQIEASLIEEGVLQRNWRKDWNL
ncbi:HGGxSTG domain-containing protein [Roseobacter sp. HKCCA2468]|uniref:HGGxSTG domain-containing protein n=1 Tax=Roseobacter sp. HKCCA2468 TaxID=3120342 RepID=UPI0030ECE419